MKPTPWHFMVALFSSWFSGISGSLSVPFAIVAAYVPTLPQRWLFSSLAVLAFLIACYGVWKVERQKRQEAEEQALKANDSRPRPELFIESGPPRTHESGVTFRLVNRSNITAVGISFSPIQIGKVTLIPEMLPFVLPARDYEQFFFKAEHVDSKCSEEPIFSATPLIDSIMLHHDKHINVRIPITVGYRDTDGRRFTVYHMMHVNAITQCVCFEFSSLTIHPC
ncbi:MAG: hypothetical protein NTY38_08980 [Acidobacteria bacterium]|nr:hypothetical protein [Acidobacteriota bacterium]